MIKLTKFPDPNNDYDTSMISMETTAVSLPDVLEDIKYFLQGCGFVINGTIIVEEHDD